MAERIKGITVEIGGDTVGLDKALKGVNKTSRSLQSELRDVQRLLKFDPNNAELMAQKQNLLNAQIENTNDKLKQLKEAEAQIQEQFKKGDIGAEQYRAFQRELQDTQQFLRHTEDALADFKAEQNNVESSTKQLNQLFQSQNKTIEDYADTLGTKLVRNIKNGTASSKDLQKAFDLVGREALGAEVDINEVRQALNKLDTGEKSIKGVRKELQKLANDAGDAEGAIEKLEGKLGGLEGAIGGIGAGIGIDAIVGKSLDMADMKAQIDISMNISDDSKDAVYNAIKAVEAYGLDAQDALSGVRKQFQLNGDVSDAENEKIVKYAGVIQKAYQDIDFNELIQETNEIAEALNMSQEDALGMTKALLDVGFPPDELDIISEYGSQLSRAGYTAEEIQGIFASGVETDSWNIDVLLDGLKEGRIKLSEFGAEVPKAIADSLAGTEISAQQLQTWGQAIAEGGDKGKQAMSDVALALTQVQDETKRNELGVAFFGTLWEEQGSKITDTILGAKEHQVALTEGTNNLAEATKKIDASPTVTLNTALSAMTEALAPLLTIVAQFITLIANWAIQNPIIAGTIVAIITVLGILIGIGMAVIPMLLGIASAGTVLSAVIAFLTSPIGIVIAIIVALIAIGVLLWKNWDWIIKKAKEVGKWVSDEFQKVYNAVTEWLGKVMTKTKEIWGKVEGFFKDIDLKQLGKDIIGGLISGITAKATELYKKATEIASNIAKKLKKALDSKSPSRVTMHIGEDVGDGLAIGMKNSMGAIGQMSNRMARIAVPEMEAPRAKATTTGATSAGKNFVLNLNSPKALDVREANRIFNRTVSKMSLMW
jgi:phage-related minor tail protein